MCSLESLRLKRDGNDKANTLSTMLYSESDCIILATAAMLCVATLLSKLGFGPDSFGSKWEEHSLFNCLAFSRSLLEFMVGIFQDSARMWSQSTWLKLERTKEDRKRERR